MTSRLPVSEAVSQRLIGFVTAQRAAATEESASASLLLDVAADAVTGGKRLRARFCETGWRAVRPTDGEAAILDAATALEIFQAAALVHDDIIDNSDTRRGRPASHRAFAHAHTQQGWSGDADGFGRSAAVLLGDLLVAWSDDLFEEALSRVHSPASARSEYARMRRDVTLGQFLDIAQESAWVVQPPSEHAPRAREIAALKSARYSVQQPLVIGGAIGGGSAAALDALRRFGLPLGLAFQLRDDLLGVFGDSAVTGKPTGDDLREGKRTLLVAYARERMADGARDRFDARLGSADLSDDAIADMQQEILDTGAADRIEAEIASSVDLAEAVLADAPLEPAATRDLRDLVVAATNRRS